MKNINPLGLFDDHFLLEALSKLGDPLQKLNKYIKWISKNLILSPPNLFNYLIITKLRLSRLDIPIP